MSVERTTHVRPPARASRATKCPSYSGIAGICLRLLSGVIVFAAFLQSASAQQSFELYRGSRELGMGGAYTGIVDDSTSLLTNPAGLGKIRDVIVTLADPQIEGSFNDTTIANVGNISQMTDAQGILDNLNSNPGLPWHALAQAFPSIVTPNLGFGVLAKESYDAMVTDKTYYLTFDNDYAAALGFSLRFFGGIIKLGVAGRLMDHTYYSGSMPSTSTGLSLSTLQSEGLGLGTDGGLIITAPIVLLPTISGVVRDIGNTSYNLSNGMFHSTTSRPSDTIQTVDAGISISPILANHIFSTLACDYHDVTTSSLETQQIRRIHLGGEVNFYDFFFLRAGMNEGYWTAGVELSMLDFQLQLASYGEEVGIEPATQEDRRWVFSFAIRF